MNQSYDMVFLGISKTASSSLFELLSIHPEIAPSYEKEYYGRLSYPGSSEEIYDLENFHITSKTKVLLDGSINTFIARGQDHKNLKKIKKAVNKLKCLYAIRNPIDRIISAFNFRIQRFREIGEVPKLFDEKGELLYYKTLVLYLLNFSDINNLFSIELMFDDVLIYKLNEIENIENRIYDFLGVDTNQINKLGKSNITYYKDHKTIDFINSNRELINKVSIQSLESVKELYKIDTDDLIKEVKEKEYVFHPTNVDEKM